MKGEIPTILDFGVGMAAALAAQMLVHCGMRVIRVEPPGGDPFCDIYSAYNLWRKGEETLETDDYDTLLANADGCIVGGEDYPGFCHTVKADELRKKYSHLVILDLTGYITKNLSARPAVDILVQARTGIVSEQSAKRPIYFAFQMPSYGAALLGVIAFQAALFEAERSGSGQVTRMSLQQGASMWMAALWSNAEKPDKSFLARTPKDVKPLIFPCADGKDIVILFGTPGSLAKTYKVLGIEKEVDPQDRGLPDLSRGPENYLADRDFLRPFFLKKARVDFLGDFSSLGVAADEVLHPGEAWDEEQTEINNIIETNDEGWRFVGKPFVSLNVSSSSQVNAPISEASGLPLGGVMVVDLGNWVAGPYASNLLCDLGADVVKIEPLEGDPHRSLYTSFASSNRGKRSIAIDLKTPEGRDIVQRICSGADIITHNLRLGIAEKLGIDSQTLHKLNPALIYLHTTAYGFQGPKAYYSGWDPIMQPYCGHAIRGGGKGDPIWYITPIVDYGTGALNTISALSALLERRLSNKGKLLHTNLLNTGIYLMSELVQSPDGSWKGVDKPNPEQVGTHPAERFYQAKDGWIAIAARSDEMAKRFAKIFGFNFGPRFKWSEKEAKQISEKIENLSLSSLLQTLSQADVWAEPVIDNGFSELCGTDMIAKIHDSSLGKVEALSPLFRMSRTGLDHKNLKPVPSLGEHTVEILKALEFDDNKIDDLYKRKIVR